MNKVPDLVDPSWKRQNQWAQNNKLCFINICMRLVSLTLNKDAIIPCIEEYTNLVKTIKDTIIEDDFRSS